MATNKKGGVDNCALALVKVPRSGTELISKRESGIIPHPGAYLDWVVVFLGRKVSPMSAICGFCPSSPSYRYTGIDIILVNTYTYEYAYIIYIIYNICNYQSKRPACPSAYREVFFRKDSHQQLVTSTV